MSALISALADNDVNVREKAAEVLGNHGDDQRVVPVLNRMVESNDDHWRVLSAAAHSLTHWVGLRERANKAIPAMDKEC